MVMVMLVVMLKNMVMMGINIVVIIESVHTPIKVSAAGFTKPLDDDDEGLW